MRSRPLDRRSFLRAAASSAFAAPLILGPGRARAHARILGDGENTHEMTHDWLRPPTDIAWGDTHGLAQDSQGRIYVAHTVGAASEKGDAVLVFDPAGKFMRSFGSEFRGGAHGLDVRREGGDEFLYHCDTRRRLVVKTTLTGKVVWSRGFPEEAEVYADASKYCPTNVAFLPDGDLLVGDGYGSSFVHRYSKDGEFRATIIRPGKDAGQVSCPHGLWVDDRGRAPTLLVADRSNRRLQRFDLEGKHLGFVTEGIRQPCHLKTRGKELLVPDLASVVTVLDAEDRVVVHLGDGQPSKLRGTPREDFIPGKFIHPHDAIWLADGSILVAEWVPIGRITRLVKKG
jgi:hypothetical protein